MSEQLKRLHEARTRAWQAITDINDAAAAEGREFTAEEEQAWDRGTAEIARLDTLQAREMERVQQEKDIAEATRDIDPPAPSEVEKLSPADEFRALAAGERRELVFHPESRDLTVGTATAGGDTVPTSFYNMLVEHMIEVSGVLAAGPTVLNTTSGENIEVPVTTAHSTATLTAEAAAIPESDPTFTQRVLGAYKYGVLIQVSRELVADTGVDLEGYLARQAGRAVGNALGAHLVTGTGSNQPAGIATGASTGVTGAGTAPTADELIDLFYSVISPYRGSASFLVNDSTMADIRKLKDGGGQYLLQPALTAATGDQLLGKRLYTDPNVAATGSSAKSVLFGDMSAYFVRLAGGIRFERSDEYAFNTDLVTFRCLVRGDGVLADQTGAVKAFVGA